ncbi:MAG: hydroxyacid dehydrogenase [Bryobacterales bacterium]|nr:hydroxyacid dehydrogenase [Bryobacterales bacterium]
MSTRLKVIMIEPEKFSPQALKLLRRFADVRLCDVESARFMVDAEWADVLWVRLRHYIDRQLMDASPSLRAIVTPTTGLNHIDLDEAGRRGIEVLSLRGEVEFLRDVRATAELTIGLMLSLIRRLPGAIAHVRHGGWNRDIFRGNELAGMPVGIVGYGRLGTLVTRYLQAFDATVLVTDPAVSASAVPAGVSLVPLEKLLRESCMVSLHANLTSETEGMFRAAEFAAMRQGSWFVNTARGELVDQNALLGALRSGRLCGAAVDVISDEHTHRGAQPLLEYARHHDNLLITPHIGGCTAESMEKTELFMVNKLQALTQESSAAMTVAGAR